MFVQNMTQTQRNTGDRNASPKTIKFQIAAFYDVNKVLRKIKAQSSSKQGDSFPEGQRIPESDSVAKTLLE